MKNKILTLLLAAAVSITSLPISAQAKENIQTEKVCQEETEDVVLAGEVKEKRTEELQTPELKNDGQLAEMQEQTEITDASDPDGTVSDVKAADNELTTVDGRFNYKITCETVDGKVGTYVTITGYLMKEEVVNFPKTIDGVQVGYISCIGDFSYDGLQQVILPEGLVRIGSNVFEEAKITSIVLPSTLKEIGGWAFQDSSLKTIVFPESLQVIDTGAFKGSDISGAVNIGKNLKDYSYDVFSGTGVTAINVSSDNQNGFFSQDGVIYRKEDNKVTLIEYPGGKTDTSFAVPAFVNKIDWYAFSYSKMQSLVIHGQCELDMWAVYRPVNPLTVILKHTSPEGYFNLWCIGGLPARSEVVVKEAEVQKEILYRCDDLVVVIKDVPSNGFAVTNVSNSKLSLDMAKRAQFQLEYTQTPAVTTDNITWTSSDETIASVSPQSGIIVPVAAGTAVITGTDDSGHAKKITVTVTNSNKTAQKISVKKSYTKAYGSSPFMLGAKVTTGDGKLTYSSSDKKIAAVGSKGKVTIQGTGSCTITVKAAATSSCKAKSVKVTLKVTPKKATVTSVKAAKGKKFTVKWKKDKTATGYQVQYSTDKKFKKNTRTVTVAKSKTVAKTISKLKKGKTYYVRVRAYKTAKVNGKSTNLYGSWSSISSVAAK